jgi:tRNA(fMet)-specific endonuclease VapC
VRRFLGNGVVVDTDVTSFRFNRDPLRVPRYEVHLANRPLVLPFAAVAEMLYGAEQRGWGSRRRLELERFIRTHDIVYPGYSLREAWAEVRAAAKGLGRPIGPQDAWLAATALYLDLPLVTHNANHLRDVPNLRLLTVPD